MMVDERQILLEQPGHHARMVGERPVVGLGEVGHLVGDLLREVAPRLDRGAGLVEQPLAEKAQHATDDGGTGEIGPGTRGQLGQPAQRRAGLSLRHRAVGACADDESRRHARRPRHRSDPPEPAHAAPDPLSLPFWETSRKPFFCLWFLSPAGEGEQGAEGEQARGLRPPSAARSSRPTPRETCARGARGAPAPRCSRSRSAAPRAA